MAKVFISHGAIIECEYLNPYFGYCTIMSLQVADFFYNEESKQWYMRAWDLKSDSHEMFDFRMDSLSNIRRV